MNESNFRREFLGGKYDSESVMRKINSLTGEDRVLFENFLNSSGVDVKDISGLLAATDNPLEAGRMISSLLGDIPMNQESPPEIRKRCVKELADYIASLR